MTNHDFFDRMNLATIHQQNPSDQRDESHSVELMDTSLYITIRSISYHSSQGEVLGSGTELQAALNSLFQEYSHLFYS